MNPTQEKTYSATDKTIHFVFVKDKEQMRLPQNSVLGLFDQVVQRYQEELEKLKDDPNFKPVYIGIKDMGEEIRVWALIEDTDRYTRQQLRNIQYGANMDIAFDNQAIVLTYYFYPKYHGCDMPPYYQKLYPCA